MKHTTNNYIEKSPIKALSESFPDLQNPKQGMVNIKQILN